MSHCKICGLPQDAGLESGNLARPRPAVARDGSSSPEILSQPRARLNPLRRATLYPVRGAAADNAR